MAQVHPVAGFPGSGGTTQPRFIMSAEGVVELAKNTINPVRCEWGSGTKSECNIVLGSWELLRKHLHMMHSHASKDGFLCHLPRCNHQLHINHQDFSNHLDSAHLSRLTFQCPIPGCEIPPLRGTESLLKHYEEHHKGINGEDFPFPPGFSRWEPVHLSPCLITHELSLARATQEQTLSHPAMSQVGDLGLGTVLVGNISSKQSHLQKLERLQLQESPSDQLLSQERSTPTPSQGIHPITRRKRIRAKQLEKVQLRADEGIDEDEDGIPKVVLDDLRCRSNNDPGRRNHRSSKGWLGVKPQPPDHGNRGVTLARKANDSVISGRRYRQLSMDLSRPQPEHRDHEKGGGSHRTGQTPKSILFNVLEYRVDEMERTGVVDTWLM